MALPLLPVFLHDRDAPECAPFIGGRISVITRFINARTGDRCTMSSVNEASVTRPSSIAAASA
jgi:hypothetical protein